MTVHTKATRFCKYHLSASINNFKVCGSSYICMNRNIGMDIYRYIDMDIYRYICIDIYQCMGAGVMMWVWVFVSVSVPVSMSISLSMLVSRCIGCRYIYICT